MKDDEVVNIAKKPLETKETETLTKNPEFRNWLLRSRAVIGVLKIVEKFC